MITVKFGGTSLADAQRIRNAAEIIRANPERRFVVVSAPGKRSPEDIKITDLLIRFQTSGDPKDFAPIEERFEEIIRELGIDLDLSADYAEMKNEPHNISLSLYILSALDSLVIRLFCISRDSPIAADACRTRDAVF